jgi:diguanylate cyclase (GGDEF)-like protein
LLGRVDPFVDEFGAPGWVSTNKWPMFDEDGKTVVGIFGISRVVTDQKRLENELHALAMTDSLTGAATRREFDACVNRELARLRREPQLTCSMLMFDLDRFKAVNDRHGHGAGDAVLRHVARLVTGSIRHGDVLGRLGGEEFGLLLPGSDAADAQVFAERLRHIVAATPCKVGAMTVKVTVSVGVAQLRSVDTGPERPMARADRAMYEAKQQGRNRVAAARD